MPANAALVFFDSFESPITSGISYGGTDAAGAIFGGGTGIQMNGSPFGYAAAPDGVQTAHIQGTGSFTETIRGLVSGTSYDFFRFHRVARRFTVTIPLMVTFLRGDNGQVAQTTTINYGGDTSFNSFGNNFYAFGNTATLVFSGTMPQTVGPNGDPSGDFNVAVDNISVTGLQGSVPEPSTWVMMLLGFRRYRLPSISQSAQQRRSLVTCRLIVRIMVFQRKSCLRAAFLLLVAYGSGRPSRHLATF